MNVLFIGDIFGRPGRNVTATVLPVLIQELGIDFCIANGENAAGGFGLTESAAQKMFNYGIDAITTGNHVWDRREVTTLLDASDVVLRPANYPPGVPGKGVTTLRKNGRTLGVINLLGRIFMTPVDCPFRCADRLLDQLLQETSAVLVDFHAEASSEKIALGWYLDGRVSTVIGTHTHVMTADERILPKGTSFLSDAGMTGPHDSVIGVRIEQSLSRILKQVPVRFSPAEHGLQFSAVLVDIDDATGKTRAISRIIRKIDE